MAQSGNQPYNINSLAETYSHFAKIHRAEAQNFTSRAPVGMNDQEVVTTPPQGQIISAVRQPELRTPTFRQHTPRGFNPHVQSVRQPVPLSAQRNTTNQSHVSQLSPQSVLSDLNDICDAVSKFRDRINNHPDLGSLLAQITDF